MFRRVKVEFSWVRVGGEISRVFFAFWPLHMHEIVSLALMTIHLPLSLRRSLLNFLRYH